MITKRIAAVLVAGSLALGLAAGAVGTTIAGDATASNTGAAACLDYMDDMNQMMAGQNGMMGGSGGMMGGQIGSGSMSDWMQQHHVAATPAPVK